MKFSKIVRIIRKGVGHGPSDWPILTEEVRQRVLAGSREVINDATLEFLGWLEVRLTAVVDVAAAKGTQFPIRDLIREEHLLTEVRSWCDERGIHPQVREIYYVRIVREVIDASCNVQELMRSSEEVRASMLGEWLEPEVGS